MRGMTVQKNASILLLTEWNILKENNKLIWKSTIKRESIRRKGIDVSTNKMQIKWLSTCMKMKEEHRKYVQHIVQIDGYKMRIYQNRKK